MTEHAIRRMDPAHVSHRSPYTRKQSVDYLSEKSSIPKLHTRKSSITWKIPYEQQQIHSDQPYKTLNRKDSDATLVNEPGTTEQPPFLKNFVRRLSSGTPSFPGFLRRKSSGATLVGDDSNIISKSLKHAYQPDFSLDVTPRRPPSTLDEESSIENQRSASASLHSEATNPFDDRESIDVRLSPLQRFPSGISARSEAFPTRNEPTGSQADASFFLPPVFGNPFADSAQIKNVELFDQRPAYLDPRGRSPSAESLATTLSIRSARSSSDSLGEQNIFDDHAAVDVQPDVKVASVAEITGIKPVYASEPYNTIERQPPTIKPISATIKISLSLSVVFSLLVGYGMRIKVIELGSWSFGMYGVLLTVDFIVQTFYAARNRRNVEKLTAVSSIVAEVARQGGEKAKATCSLQDLPQPAALPSVGIAVVGYREDEDAWMACLKSLQVQEYPLKKIVGVVDGNDRPDLDMADAFVKAFPEGRAKVIHLPECPSKMYKAYYWEYFNALDVPKYTRFQLVKYWLTQAPKAGQDIAHHYAWNKMLAAMKEQDERENWSQWDAICFAQPHGHKRHAMFTSFIAQAYHCGAADLILTTDSDTLMHVDAVTNLVAMISSNPQAAGCTGDVAIWNRKDSLLALMSSLRYWFAFNVERACQSANGCVGCLSGPIGLYRTSDLMSILSPWILQTFLGKETTFGDDRHLTNRLLSLGHKTVYTHKAVCESDSPAGYVRWVKQQTRWSKSFFREAYWFPKSFAYHDFWLTVETSKQALYPLILTITVLELLWSASPILRPAFWVGTLFGVALIKSCYGVIVMRDPTYFLFAGYGIMYFMALLPSKLFAMFTVSITTWGTSARSKSEFKRGETFGARTEHVAHLVLWYMLLIVGLAYFLSDKLAPVYIWLVALGCTPLIVHLYYDVIISESKYHRQRFDAWRQKRKDLKTAGAPSVEYKEPEEKERPDPALPQNKEIPPQNVQAAEIEVAIDSARLRPTYTRAGSSITSATRDSMVFVK